MSAAPGGGGRATDRGSSAPFQVVGDADHFIVRLHPPNRFHQADPVTLTIIARDVLGSTVPDYAATVSIDDVSGTLLIESPVGWVNGVGTATISFPSGGPRNDTVTVADGAITGTSARF